MASGIYNRFFANLMNKESDLEADTIKVALLDNTHAFTATNNTWADVSANEVSGIGYTAGGATLTEKTVTQANPTVWGATDVTWSGVTVSAYHAVIYDDTLAGDDLIASIDFGGLVGGTDVIIKITWSASGIISLSE